MPCRATQDRWGVLTLWRALTKMGSIGGRKGKSLQYFRLKNTMNGMKKQKDLTLEDEF